MFCECRDILVRRGGATVLDVGRLSIPAGRVTAVVGPNGAGKTTLLEVLALLRRPDGGSLRLWGTPADVRDRRLRLRVVMVMHPGYVFRGRVWHNVLYGLRARGVRRAEAWRRAGEALEMVGLAGFGDRQATSLSAGERQRLNLARAIAVAPEAVLLDEPTANVDSRTVQLVGEIFRRLRDRRGTTIVHTSPGEMPLRDVTDGVIELANGRPHRGDGAAGLAAGGGEPVQ